MSRDIPIIFSAPMVRALLEARKSQTRRLAWKPARASMIECKHGFDTCPECDKPKPSSWQRAEVGDRLWVREDWRVSKKWDSTKPVELPARTMSVMFNAGGSIANTEFGWTPDLTWPPAGVFPDWAGRRRASMHMPRWASRLTLIVTATKIEQLRDIGEADAIAEGVEKTITDHYGVIGPNGGWLGSTFDTAAAAFSYLWMSLHGVASWEANPVVVALTVKPIKANIDAPEARAA